jgi:hypothetical protein
MCWRSTIREIPGTSCTGGENDVNPHRLLAVRPLYSCTTTPGHTRPTRKLGKSGNVTKRIRMLLDAHHVSLLLLVADELLPRVQQYSSSFQRLYRVCQADHACNTSLTEATSFHKSAQSRDDLVTEDVTRYCGI